MSIASLSHGNKMESVGEGQMADCCAHLISMLTSPSLDV